MLKLSTNAEILIDDKRTGLGLSQQRKGTVVYTREDEFAGIRYQAHRMPHQRYSTAYQVPASGAAGVTQLEEDVRALLARLAGRRGAAHD